MTSIFFFLLFFTVFLDFISGFGETNTHHVISVSSIFPIETSCNPIQGHNGTALPVFHRHGPCSPLPPKKKTARQLLQKDQHRADSVRSRVESSLRRQEAAEKLLKKRSAVASSYLPATNGDALDTADYVVTVGIGTPKQNMTVVFDTGSDVTWVQCQPCAGFCYNQQQPIFDPAKSSTYSNVTCAAVDCYLRLAASTSVGCLTSTCIYNVQYADQSYSVGILAGDTLTLTPNDTVQSFKFGCGQRNEGSYGAIAGMLGLGRGPISLVSQSAARYNRLFSYCIPSSLTTAGFLSLGVTKSPTRSFTYTPLLTGASPTYYYVNMVGITVAGQLLPIRRSVFYRSGTIIDSGTVISRLPPAAYSALRAAFRREMSRYPLARRSESLDTCYDLEGYTEVMVPKVRLLFQGGAALDVPLTGILLPVGPSLVCLGFIGNTGRSDIGIVGNMQQMTYEVAFDVGRRRVGFASSACS